jgi:hypothetical protein
MSELIKKLSQSRHVQCRRPEKSTVALKECIDRNYVHIFFTETGTELSMNLFLAECKINQNLNEEIHVVGGVILNYERVKCVADINPITCEGTGYLVPVDIDEYKRITASA